MGIPPIVANATATTMAVPGYIASVWAYRHDIRAEGALRLGTIIALAAVGGLLGAVLLVVTSPDAFLALIPWLLLTATLLFAVAPRLQNISEASDIGIRSPAMAGRRSSIRVNLWRVLQRWIGHYHARCAVASRVSKPSWNERA